MLGLNKAASGYLFSGSFNPGRKAVVEVLSKVRDMQAKGEDEVNIVEYIRKSSYPWYEG